MGIIDSFLVKFRNHPGSPLSDTGPVRRHVASRLTLGEMERWDVLFAAVRRESAQSLVWELPGIGGVICQRRVADPGSDGSKVSFALRRRVAGRGVERVGLTKPQRRAAEREWESEAESAGQGGRKSRNYSDRIYRKVRERPLLVIHLLAIGKKGEDLRGEPPVVAWSISFPRTNGPEETVEYVVNAVWFQEHIGANSDWGDDDDE